MQSKLQAFLVQFTKLKNEINRRPSNLEWIPQEKPSLAELCQEVDDCASSVHRLLAEKAEKHLVVPSIFADQWKEYCNNYEALVRQAAAPIRERRDNEFLELLGQAAARARKEGKTDDEFWDELKKNLNVPVGATFNPLEDDAAELVDDIFAIIHDIVDNDIMPDVFTDKQIGAFRYFYGTIGVDLRAINSRWGKAPQLFIPEKALNKNIEPLGRLYNEAVRCHIFGLNIAATAMCRSLLEHILLEHYGIPKGKLVKIIAIAEKRFAKLKQVNMDAIRDAGNRVMHTYEQGSEVDDNAVIEYILTLRFLVQNVPDRK